MVLLHAVGRTWLTASREVLGQRAWVESSAVSISCSSIPILVQAGIRARPMMMPTSLAKPGQ